MGVSEAECNRVGKLRCGFTTGTCAAAASEAAVIKLLSGRVMDAVTITVPRGDVLRIPIHSFTESEDSVRCTVIKDGGDDIDATHGAEICSEVRRIESGVVILGGRGVGRVTKKGLDQPVGSAAINSTPRRMIVEAVSNAMRECFYQNGIEVTISVPSGEEIAGRTFNPHLGILDGISIIGTSGIVVPMSEKAIIDTIFKDMDMRKAEGQDVVLVVPGNYGEIHADSIDGIDGSTAVKCSNFIGDMLDHACEIGLDVVLVGNIGKLVKVAGGIMNTHSRNADARMEILAAYASLAGGDRELISDIMGCTSTDDALSYMEESGCLGEVSELLMQRISHHLRKRTRGRIRTSAMMFSMRYGLLGKTDDADSMMEALRCV